MVRDGSGQGAHRGTTVSATTVRQVNREMRLCLVQPHWIACDTPGMPVTIDKLSNVDAFGGGRLRRERCFRHQSLPDLSR